MKKIIEKMKNKYFLFSFVTVMFCIICLASYGIFVVTTNKYRSSEMYFGKLLYQIILESKSDSASVDGKVVTLTADNATSTVFMKIISLNPVKSRYNVEYSVTSGNVSVRYSSVTGWLPQGYLDGTNGTVYEKIIKIKIINASEAAATVALDVAGGYTYNSYSNIETLSGYTKLVNNEASSIFDDSSAPSVKVLSTRIKNDTNCIPTASSPCIYGGEISRNYVTYSGDLYRIIGLYLIDDVESVKIVKATNYETTTTYNNHQTTLETWEDNLYLPIDYQKLSSPFCTTDALTCTSPTFDYGLITKKEYENMGMHYSYLNNETDSLTTTENGSDVYYIKADGTLGTIAKTSESNVRPVLYLQEGIKVLKTTDGTSDSPYQLSPRGDLFINSITIDDVPSAGSPTSGYYVMESSCTCDQETCAEGTSITWDVYNHTINYTLGADLPTVVCDLDFYEIDEYFATITIDGQPASATPTESGYEMTATCIGGTAIWDDDAHEVKTTITSSPLICSLAFIESNIVRLQAYGGTLSVSSLSINANSSGTATLTAETGYTTTGTGVKCTSGISGSVSGSTLTITTTDITKGSCQIVTGKTFDYTGGVQEFNALIAGTYKLQVWGAEGGYRSSSSYSGKGGFSQGNILLNSTETLYVYVGGSGQTGGSAGGFNGGGARSSYYGGGGATDIRFIEASEGSWYNTSHSAFDTDNSLHSRVIVAGGGGSDGATSRNGMYGGGSTAGSASQSYGSGGYGGTQTGNSWYLSNHSTGLSSQTDAYATFGYGGNGIYYASGYGGAGGGGWYGGSGAYPDGSGDDDRGGGGGSGWIYTSSTYTTWANAVSVESNWFEYSTPEISKHYLTSASTTAGNTSFVSPTGSTETGHSGNGYAIITFVP